MATNSTLTKCLIGEARMNWPRVFEPESFNGSEPKYNITLSFPKTDQALAKKIQGAINECAEKAKAQYGGKLPKSFKLPELKDGDEDFETEGYAGLYVIKASSKYKPEIVKKATVMGKTQLVPITSADEFYAGCYGYASVTFFAYDTPASKGISCGLNSILKTKDGERFDGAGSSAEADYADILNDIEDPFEDDEVC